MDKVYKAIYILQKIEDGFNAVVDAAIVLMKGLEFLLYVVMAVGFAGLLLLTLGEVIIGALKTFGIL